MLCANCGVEEGTPKPGFRGTVSLSVADWAPDKGLVLSCSDRCCKEWRGLRCHDLAPHLEATA